MENWSFKRDSLREVQRLKTRLLFVSFIAVVVAVVGLAGIQPAYAQVECNDSSWPVSNETELNEAIACFNAKTTAGAYTISLTQDIALTASATTIHNTIAGVELVIDGGSFVVDGQDISGVRPFEIAANTDVTMNQITVTGGNATLSGGGIRNFGNLTVNNSTIANNMTGAQGGGIYVNNGALTMNSSTISGNSAGTTGGGIDFDGSGAISNSTISGNSAGTTGGGVEAKGIGTHLAIESSTVTGNAATSGAGGVRLTLGGMLTMSNSIVADSTGAPDCDVAGISIFTDGGHNLVESPGVCAFPSGTSITGQDPVLDPLADNGGDTQTHALLAGSPAIDQIPTADASCNPGSSVDQRGAPRANGPGLGGNACDIGAYETESSPTAITLKSFSTTAVSNPMMWLVGLMTISLLSLATLGLATKRRKS